MCKVEPTPAASARQLYVALRGIHCRAVAVPVDVVCVSSTAGAVQGRGVVPYADKGWWSKAEPNKAYPCTKAAWCLGAHQCRRGHTGTGTTALVLFTGQLASACALLCVGHGCNSRADGVLPA